MKLKEYGVKEGRTNSLELHSAHEKTNFFPHFINDLPNFKAKISKFHNVILFWTLSPILKAWGKISISS